MASNARPHTALLACLLLASGGALMAQAHENLLGNPRLSEGLFGPRAWALNAAEENRATWRLSPDGEELGVLLDGSGRDWAGLSSRQVPAQPGDELTVGAWMRCASEEPSTDADRLFVRFFRTRAFAGQDGPPLDSVGEEWTLVTGTLTVPEDVDGVDVSVQIRSQAAVLVGAVSLLRVASAEDVAEVLPPPKDAGEWAEVDVSDRLPEDADSNGLPDTLEAALGITPDDGAVSTRRTRAKTTSFQTPTGYREDNDLKVDAVIVAGNSEDSIRSWDALGYEPHVMAGFRAGPDYVDTQGHSDECQTNAGGTRLDCGPGSYYMVPTENRRAIFREYFADAVRRGAKAACPEEPEFFSQAGYSESFKREWQARYGEPWQDPASSVDARLKAERLKVDLERQLLAACYEGARSVDPGIKTFLLAHSPLNYAAWAITFGHHDAISNLDIDAMVAQVWTGTARSAVPYAGDRRTRTFGNAYLEYASSLGLVRGTGMELWFLMDPVEDNPDLPMEDYHDNYERTLAASLMFPEVTHFETMPWPARIFGRVPADYATVISTVVNALSDMQNQEDAETDAGPDGIGAFLADSAMWQRGEPGATNLDGFYGVTLPLLMRGIPVRVPHLDRVTDPGYLGRYKLLFVSYDYQKPMRPEINQALADWVDAGGVMVVLGGENAYNEASLWWRDMGFESPQDHLLSLCGFDVSGRRVMGSRDLGDGWAVVAETDYAGREGANEAVVEIDLSPYLEDGAALLRFEDTQQADGWGPLISEIALQGTRNGRPFRTRLTPGTPEESALIAADEGSQVNAARQRFCDTTSYVVYRLPFDRGSEATVRVIVGNQYRILAAQGSAPLRQEFVATDTRALGVRELEIPSSLPLVAYAGDDAAPVYEGPSARLLSERAFGRGRVLFFAAPASYFASTPEAADQLRALAGYAMGLDDDALSRHHIMLRRGRYVIAKTFDRPLSIEGDYVNLLEADLPVVEGHRMAEDSVALLYDVSGYGDEVPALLYSSSCVEWQDSEDGRLRAILSGAEGTRGTCRLHTGGRRVEHTRLVDVDGEQAAHDVTREGDTALLAYDNQPFGLALDVKFAAR